MKIYELIIGTFSAISGVVLVLKWIADYRNKRKQFKENFNKLDENEKFILRKALKSSPRQVTLFSIYPKLEIPMEEYYGSIVPAIEPQETMEIVKEYKSRAKYYLFFGDEKVKGYPFKSDKHGFSPDVYFLGPYLKREENLTKKTEDGGTIHKFRAALTKEGIRTAKKFKKISDLKTNFGPLEEISLPSIENLGWSENRS